jgi:hypothetical protein
MQRAFKPWIQPQFLFQLSSLAKVQKQCLEVLHSIPNLVIQTRKQQYLQRRKCGQAKDENSDIGKHNSRDKALLTPINSKAIVSLGIHRRHIAAPNEPKECVHNARRKLLAIQRR